MANILAIGVTDAVSSSVVLTGTPSTLFLSTTTGSVPPTARALIQVQSAGGNWQTIGFLNQATPALTMTATGTYRVYRPAADAAFGVEQG